MTATALVTRPASPVAVVAVVVVTDCTFCGHTLPDFPVEDEFGNQFCTNDCIENREEERREAYYHSFHCA